MRRDDYYWLAVAATAATFLLAGYLAGYLVGEAFVDCLEFHGFHHG